MTDKEKRMAGVMAYNESVKQKKAEDVKKAIDKLKKEGEFTLADLCREANVSRTYFTKHPEMRELANKYIIPTGFCKNRGKDSADAYIQILKKENKDLKNVLKLIIESKNSDTSPRKRMSSDEKEIYLKILERNVKNLEYEISLLKEEYKDCVPLATYQELAAENEMLKNKKEDKKIDKTTPTSNDENDKYKEKYKIALEKIKKLEAQLQAAYDALLPDHL